MAHHLERGARGRALRRDARGGEFCEAALHRPRGDRRRRLVCSALVLTVLVAKLVGCVLPLAAKRIGFDPAVMASPFITTIVDALSLLIYFQIACAVLHIG
ncbi:MAG: magnesium transporter [Acutalibacteraceae bacterium]